ncbi:beta-galactosidase trimerization domain-containing protein [Pseudalkalibacillus decolorationis]|uniref:beta-galactosidase trimerization domain-containing protein n=1 Tax=Pseudalkalibacillus decolorationis TaxID=163879 RepID=UPI002148EB70|nr:beta-galactosidase trimerization domain-containing protein [Pseudalkalibacillus decolorationis]
MNKIATWKDKPLRIVDFIPPEPGKYEALDLIEQFQIRKNLEFNAEHVEVHDITEGESGITYYPSDCAVQERKNILEKISDSYGSLGIHPIVYFNVHWLAESLATLHPHWQQHDVHSERIQSAYGTGGYSCINSPFRDYVFQTIRNLARYSIKGVFLDGPFYRVEGCYCPSCRELFYFKYKYELPDWKNCSNSQQNDFFNFKRESIAAFMKEASEALKKINSDTIIYMNSPQLVPTKFCSRDNRLTVKYQDMLLAEGGFLSGNLRELPIWKPAATAQLLETQSSGKPYCVAIAGRIAPWSRYLLSPAETWLAHAMAAAHGANTWYGVYNDNNLDTRMDTVKEINHFLIKNEKYYMNTKSMASIALMWSYATANQYQSSAEETDFTAEQDKLSDQNKGDARGSFIGLYDALSRSRIPFDVIDDESINDRSFKKYEVIILPNISVLTENQSNLIKDYVKNGGNIIASFDTSLYDENGKQRAQPLLADVFGINEFKTIRKCKYDHIQVDQNNELLDGIDQTLIPAALLGANVIPDPTSTSIMSYRETQKSRYSELPNQTIYPYILRNKFGEGGSVYFAGNVGEFYESYAFPEYRKLIQNAILSLTDVSIKIKTAIHLESIHVSLRKQQDDRIMLHLINYSGSMTRPITEVIPITDIQIEFEIEEPIQSVKTLKLNEQLSYHQNYQKVNIELPILNEYEVVIITLKN